MRRSPLSANPCWPVAPDPLADIAMPALGSAEVGTIGAEWWSRATPGPGTTRRIGLDPDPSLVMGRFLGTVVVTLHGGIDLAASLRLAGALRDLIHEDASAVVVDLGDASRIDGLGVDVVASAARAMAQRGRELRLARPTSPVLGALTAAGLAGLVSTAPEQARRAWASGRPRSSASRRGPIGAHPAGSGRFDRDQQGDTS